MHDMSDSKNRSLIVIALGGNALLQPNEPLTAERLKANIIQAAQWIVKAAVSHRIVIVHGNGPQVGLLALQAEAYRPVPPYPFDILNAESQGMIGYLLQQSLQNQLPNKGSVTLVSQVLVDATDPAFLNPTKPIGPFYPIENRDSLKREHSEWHLQETKQGLRRVVASPFPIAIIELESIQVLLERDFIVIAGGGGGIPCMKNNIGELIGVEAVIDKDLTAGLLASTLKADRLIILTNVDAVYEAYGMPEARAIKTMKADQVDAHSFEKGSMQPKVMAAIQFVHNTRGSASIGHLRDLSSILEYKTGTHIS